MATAASRSRLGVFGAAFVFALCALVLTTPAAHAGLLPGCSAPTSKPFARWDDDAYYSLIPGGSFEPGAPAWSLAGGAQIVAGNEPFYVRSAEDSSSLLLPPGSVATTPRTCYALADWHMRFFVTGSGTVRVTVVVRNLLGVLSILDGGSVTGGGTWSPSPRVRLTVNSLTNPLLSGGSITLRFSSVGSAPVQIDDAYLDPLKSD